MEFTQWEWGQLVPAQKDLYREVMLENIGNLASVGLPASKPCDLAIGGWRRALCVREGNFNRSPLRSLESISQAPPLGAEFWTPSFLDCYV